MTSIYLDGQRRSWVELNAESVTVSWPGGMRTLTYEDPVVDLLAAVREAVDDVIATRPTPKEMADARHTSRERGFNEGWEAHKREVEREQEAQDRAGNGRRRTVRDVDTGTKL
jgi:hypothetical protein